MRIDILARYGRLGASSRVRTLQYVPFLSRHDIDVRVRGLVPDEQLLRMYAGRRRSYVALAAALAKRAVDVVRSHGAQVAWLEKEVMPFLPARAEEWLSALGAPYVADYDDALFHNYDLSPNPLVRRFFADKIDRVMRHAVMVFAGNEYLAERARRAGARRVEIVPTVVDLERYRVNEEAAGEATVGWIGSPVTVKYLLEVERVLAELCRRRHARMVIVGGGRFHLRSTPTRRLDWSEQSEVESIQRFGIGIMPLIDSPWERGKCGYKLIQCMACGIPVVASPVGVNVSIVEHGVNGFLAGTQDEWYAALDRLLGDEALRRSMGAAARRKVESDYSLQVMAPRVLALLREAAGGTG